MTAPVVLDACVLYPEFLRSFLLYAAADGVFDPRWSDAIHDEWTRNVLADRPDLSPAQLDRTRRLMDRAAPDARVHGHEPLIPTFTLPDPDDRHVLAVAVHSGAGRIVTFNLRDFPATALAPHGVAAVHPDAFVLDLIVADAPAVVAAARNHRESLTRPSMTVEQFLANLARHGLPAAAALLAASADRL